MTTTPDDIGELVRDLTAVHSEQGFLIKSDIRGRIEALVARREAVALEAPMGVSAWEAHGKRFGYWNYFTNQTLESFVATLGERVGEQVHGVSIEQNEPKNASAEELASKLRFFNAGVDKTLEAVLSEAKKTIEG